MDRLKECQIYIKKWYLGEEVVTIRMDAGSVLDNLCIQAVTVELLRELIDRPIPDHFKEGSVEFNTWIDHGLQRCLVDTNFGFNVDQCSAIKNLAWNYWLFGIRATHAQPGVEDRLFKCSRGELEKWANIERTQH